MIASYIGYAADSDIRYKATSGGIGSAMIKYLFESKTIQTSITFDYNNKSLQYVPRLIYRYEDYNITGSIYHEIKLIQFIKQHIHEIQGGFACFVLPCQARAIRSMLEKAGIPNILIGLTCSSQQSIDATHYLLKRMQIVKENVTRIQFKRFYFFSHYSLSQICLFVLFLLPFRISRKCILLEKHRKSL